MEKTSHPLHLFQDRVFQFCLVTTIIVQAILWLILFQRVEVTSDPIPLHYDIYFGINLIGPWYKMYFLPLFGIIIFTVNVLFGSLVYRREKVASWMLFSAGTFAQIILLFSAHLVTTYI